MDDRKKEDIYFCGKRIHIYNNEYASAKRSGDYHFDAEWWTPVQPRSAQ